MIYYIDIVTCTSFPGVLLAHRRPSRYGISGRCFTAAGGIDPRGRAPGFRELLLDTAVVGIQLAPGPRTVRGGNSGLRWRVCA